MPKFEMIKEAAMPRMRSYLSRAGQRSLVSDVPPEIMALARSVYEEAYEVCRPVAYARDWRTEDLPAALPEELAGCPSCTLLFFSLGGAFDSRVAELLDAGETARAVFFDAWGSESVEALAQSVDAELREEHGAGTIRFAPGYAGFDITHNASWLRAALDGAGELDEICSADERTGIITPRKSIICAIGWHEGEGGDQA